MSSIKHLLAKTIRDVLLEACVTNIADGDPTKVDIVAIRNAGGKAGKARFVLTVKHFDPLDATGWQDSTVGNRQHTNTLGMTLPAGEIAGSTFEMIRGIVELNGNLTLSKENIEEADEYAQEVLARAKFALRNARPKFSILSDSYGEYCFSFIVASGTEYDSGSDNSNSTRYFLRWAAYTKYRQQPPKGA